MPPKRSKAAGPPPKKSTTSSDSSTAAAAANSTTTTTTTSNNSSGGPISCSGCSAPCDSDPLRCPTCVDLGLPPSHYCTQECFTANWAEHKKKHDLCCIPSFDGSTFRFSGALRNGLLSPKRTVPKAIARPDYAGNRLGRSVSEEKAYRAYNITVNSAEEIADMRKVCRDGREILNFGLERIRAGMSTDDIDRIVHEKCIADGYYPSPLNYNGFKKSICTSLNEVICHGVPDSTLLNEGDIINLDVSGFDGNYHFDLNETIFVGKPEEESIRLVHCAFESMIAGMCCLKAGGLYKHPGEKIQERAALDGFSTARGVVSHGVGKLFHSPPDIAHYYPNRCRGSMAAGHIITMEPMVNAGAHADRMWPDEWTVVTTDGKNSAQFENACLIVDDAEEFQASSKSFLPCEILTSLSAPYLDKPFYMRQLEEMGIPVPKSRLPEIGLPAPVFGAPPQDKKDDDE